MTLEVTSTEIPDVLIIEPQEFSDNRGFFYESYNKKEFDDAIGWEVIFVQENHSKSNKGVLRGLHYQLENAQGKLIRVSKGRVYDVVVDLRQSSKTYGQWIGIELSSENKKQLWVPAGFAHGFLVISDEADLLYKTTEYRHQASEQSIIWSDSTLRILWPDIGVTPILSPKDLAGQLWAAAPKF